MEDQMNKQVLLFLSNKTDERILQRYEAIKKVSSPSIDVFFLYHQQGKLPSSIRCERHFAFTDTILSELGYKPIESSLLPGSNHFPLLQFFLQKEKYDFYWLIEDDVYFNGDWCDFFRSFQDDKSDFLTSGIEKFNESPHWYWWYTLRTPLNNPDRIKSFNPVYRLSGQALACIDSALKNGWSGHHEAVMPTILFNKGFTLSDFGGNGSFVPGNRRNKYYTKDTMSYLPVYMDNIPNYLYHPFKVEKTIDPDQLKKNCILSVVGRNSLHKQWIDESSDYDVHLIVYDDSYCKFYKDTDFISCRKGDKLRSVYNYLTEHPVYLEKYDYFFIPDDDISISPGEISRLFFLMKNHNLQIAQPALRDSYYSYEHTLYDKYSLRCSNFVEMMHPCFSREALKKVLFSFNENNSGWEWNSAIDRANFLTIKNLLTLVSERILQKLQARKPCASGLSGLTGVALFFVHYYRLTEKRFFLDYALNIVDRIIENTESITDDFTLQSGLPGFSWFIEYLAQQGLIENNTDDILSDINSHYIQYYQHSLQTNPGDEDYLGIAVHFLMRTYNPHFKDKARQEEEDALVKLIQSICSQVDAFRNETKEVDKMTRYGIFLSTALQTIRLPGMEDALHRLTPLINRNDPPVRKYADTETETIRQALLNSSDLGLYTGLSGLGMALISTISEDDPGISLIRLNSMW